MATQGSNATYTAGVSRILTEIQSAVTPERIAALNEEYRTLETYYYYPFALAELYLSHATVGVPTALLAASRLCSTAPAPSADPAPYAAAVAAILSAAPTLPRARELVPDVVVALTPNSDALMPVVNQVVAAAAAGGAYAEIAYAILASMLDSRLASSVNSFCAPVIAPAVLAACAPETPLSIAASNATILRLICRAAPSFMSSRFADIARSLFSLADRAIAAGDGDAAAAAVSAITEFFSQRAHYMPSFIESAITLSVSLSTHSAAIPAPLANAALELMAAVFLSPWPHDVQAALERDMASAGGEIWSVLCAIARLTDNDVAEFEVADNTRNYEQEYTGVSPTSLDLPFQNTLRGSCVTTIGDIGLSVNTWAKDVVNAAASLCAGEPALLDLEVALAAVSSFLFTMTGPATLYPLCGPALETIVRRAVDIVRSPLASPLLTTTACCLLQYAAPDPGSVDLLPDSYNSIITDAVVALAGGLSANSRSVQAACALALAGVINLRTTTQQEITAIADAAAALLATSAGRVFVHTTVLCSSTAGAAACTGCNETLAYIVRQIGGTAIRRIATCATTHLTDPVLHSLVGLAERVTGIVCDIVGPHSVTSLNEFGQSVGITAEDANNMFGICHAIITEYNVAAARDQAAEAAAAAAGARYTPEMGPIPSYAADSALRVIRNVLSLLRPGKVADLGLTSVDLGALAAACVHGAATYAATSPSRNCCRSSFFAAIGELFVHEPAPVASAAVELAGAIADDVVEPVDGYWNTAWMISTLMRGIDMFGELAVPFLEFLVGNISVLDSMESVARSVEDCGGERAACVICTVHILRACSRAGGDLAAGAAARVAQSLPSLGHIMFDVCEDYFQPRDVAEALAFIEDFAALGLTYVASSQQLRVTNATGLLQALRPAVICGAALTPTARQLVAAVAEKNNLALQAVSPEMQTYFSKI